MSERKLATIQKIEKLVPIEGADLIEVAKIKGWQCVVKKGEFQEGDLCVYFEIDSFLPVKPEFEFLRKSSFKTMADGSEGFRLRTIKLKKEISQGLALPITILTKNYHLPNVESINDILNYDVTELLGVKKYEAPIPANLAGKVKGSFPSFLIKTDEERCLSSDTLILTEDGINTIKNICDTKYRGKVASYNEITNNIEFNSIKNHSIMNNNNDWYEIETKSGYKIKVTSNHRIYIPSLKCYREVKDLNINDDILIFTEKN